MKKVVFISLIAFLASTPASMMGQKKASAKSTTKSKVVVAPVIKTTADSISYVYGVALVESLPMHLAQIGVLADTAMVTAEYKSRIDAENDQTKKAQLENQLKTKVDSISKANKTNMADFIAGFKQAMLENNNSKAFNSGIAIASQVETMSDNFAKQVLANDESINKAAFLSAFVSSLNKEKPLLNIESPQAFIEQKVQAAQQRKEIEEAEKLHSLYADQIAAGRKFFAENKTKDGIVALPNGLQYKVVSMGNGNKPSATDIVKVHYKGTLLDGTPFDSSYDRGEPASFGVGQVIKGWTEALQLMPVGSKWTLYIPYDLAYGSRDQGVIKPFSDLIFDIELLEIIPVADVHGTDK